MKTMRFVTLFIIIPLFLSGQAKYDYNWILGYPSHGDSVKMFNGTLFDFNKQPVLIQYFDIKIEMNPNTSISDKNGSLLFYSNGCVVANSQHAIMENGTGINEGGIGYEQTCLSDPNYFNGYSVSDQGIISIPYPGTSNKYAIFHLHKPDHDRLNKDLLMTTIDMNKDGGLGAVINKNNLIVFKLWYIIVDEISHLSMIQSINTNTSILNII
jgi:hypothetical protein